MPYQEDYIEMHERRAFNQMHPDDDQEELHMRDSEIANEYDTAGDEISSMRMEVID